MNKAPKKKSSDAVPKYVAEFIKGLERDFNLMAAPDVLGVCLLSEGFGTAEIGLLGKKRRKHVALGKSYAAAVAWIEFANADCHQKNPTAKAILRSGSQLEAKAMAKRSSGRDESTGKFADITEDVSQAVETMNQRAEQLLGWYTPKVEKIADPDPKVLAVKAVNNCAKNLSKLGARAIADRVIGVFNDHCAKNDGNPIDSID
jgi:hypothetical protein